MNVRNGNVFSFLHFFLLLCEACLKNQWAHAAKWQHYTVYTNHAVGCREKSVVGLNIEKKMY